MQGTVDTVDTVCSATNAAQKLTDVVFNSAAGVALSLEEMITGNAVNSFESIDALAGVSFEQFMSDFVVL